MDAEIHIAGIVVHAPPGRAEVVAEALSAMAGTEVRAVSETGKLVVVCESDSGARILELIARIRDLPGVADAALVYQHAESAAAMDEEINDEGDPSRVH